MQICLVVRLKIFECIRNMIKHHAIFYKNHYFCSMMMKKIFLIVCIVQFNIGFGQIIIDNTAPNDNPTYLIDNVLLGGGVTATNHSYSGDSAQIGWFNASNTFLGIDSGIVLSTGSVYELDPDTVLGFITIQDTVTDPDLLTVANSVPPLIGQTFSVSGIHNVAKLEFDFVPTSDTVTFRYVFGSQEYFGFENTSFNDVFGFFLSGPGIAGPYANGAINLAIVPGSNPELPITISSVNSVTPINQQYFVDNQGGLDTIASADGLTTVLTATAIVQCNETYHIRLAIADGSDQALSSYVWLEAGSFFSPTLEVVNDFGIDSTVMEIPCNASIMLMADGGVGASYQWFDSTGALIGSDSSIIVGPGTFWVEATSFGCPVNSDTLKVIADLPPSFDLGPDITIPCNTTSRIDPVVTGGLGNYQYSWSNTSTDSFIVVGGGTYHLTVDDGTGCLAKDTIIVTEDANPTTTISGGGEICADGSVTTLNFNFSGLTPWSMTYTNGTDTVTRNSSGTDLIITTSTPGDYTIIDAMDVNSCVSNTVGNATVVLHPLPEAIITPNEITIYFEETIELKTGDYAYYEWYNEADSLLGTLATYEATQPGTYYVWVEDEHGCTDISEIAKVNMLPKTALFVPSTFTPNNDDHNELFVIKGQNIVTYHLQIYNRWGALLFVSNNIEKYWDGMYEGNTVPEGTYFYTINVVGEDAVAVTKSGTIDVIY